MKKKGQVGLDVAKSVMYALLGIAIVGFIIVVILSNLNSSADNILSDESISANNETLTTVTNTTGESITYAGLHNCAATVSIVTNATTGSVINSGNYTVSGCTIISLADVATGNINNGLDWNVTYTATYTPGEFNAISNNVSQGTSSFFANTTTWFALIAIVVIILIIGIVIVAVNRFGSSGYVAKDNLL